MSEEKKVTITIDVEKVKKYLKIFSIVFLFILLLLPAIMQFFPSNEVVVKEIDGELYRGKIVFTTDNAVYLYKSKNSYKELDIAYSDNSEIDFSLSKIEVSKLDSVYYIIKSEEKVEDLEKEKNDQKFDPKYLGNYKIKVSGHKGYLYLRYKNNILYGGVKFPDWANGVYEPIKRLNIKNGYISFTRSATTVKEIRRIGASAYFTQKFSGRYYQQGRIIKGFFYNNGAKQSWEAEKIK